VVSFNLTQVDRKGNTQKTSYEFNFTDIDKIQAYQNKFEIAIPDIESSRKIKKAIIKIS